MKRKTVQTKYDVPVRRAFRLHRFSFIYAVNDLWEDAYTCPINVMDCTTKFANEIREIIIYALLATLSKSLAESRFAFLVE